VVELKYPGSIHAEQGPFRPPRRHRQTRTITTLPTTWAWVGMLWREVTCPSGACPHSRSGGKEMRCIKLPVLLMLPSLVAVVHSGTSRRLAKSSPPLNSTEVLYITHVAAASVIKFSSHAVSRPRRQGMRPSEHEADASGPRPTTIPPWAMRVTWGPVRDGHATKHENALVNFLPLFE